MAAGPGVRRAGNIGASLKREPLANISISVSLGERRDRRIKPLRGAEGDKHDCGKNIRGINNFRLEGGFREGRLKQAFLAVPNRQSPTQI